MDVVSGRTAAAGPAVLTAAKFAAVGAVGFGVQLSALWVLTRAGVGWLPATIVAVECAIAHNYWWHRAWTFSGRRGSFLRFNASTALTSIAGNVALMALFVQLMHMPVLAANVVTVAVLSVANFLIGDLWVFVPLLLVIATPAQAAPSTGTLAAWNQYVSDVETQISVQRVRAAPGPVHIEGETIDVGAGTISDWRGSVFIPHVTLDRLLYRLQDPGTPPPQEDVVASRVLSRGPDRLHVYIRLTRHALVTISYDTEHEMTFHRVSPTVATARSVATLIREVGGGDKGFLWRLNSYWYYEEAAGGVVVTLRSLTLSRDVPMLVKPLAGRIVPRIARESVARTLEALQKYFD